MRDFRDAKAMAHTLRAALAAQNLKITVAQSLELVAKAFGAADWNTLCAAINADGQKALPSPPFTTSGPSGAARIGFSAPLEATLHQAVRQARQRRHDCATVEHLLLALTDDPDASIVMVACGLDLAAVQQTLAGYLDTDPQAAADVETRPSAGFQRAIQRAFIHVQASGLPSVTGAQVLVALFSEPESRAVRLLDAHGMTRIDAVNVIVHGAGRREGGAAA